MTEWTILAPGPSLKNIRPELFKPLGPVVAINNAVLCPVPVNFWCCQDQAEKFLPAATALKTAAPPYPIVWCRESNAYAWSALGFQTWPHPAHEEPFKALFLKAQPPIGFTALTITTALARVVGHGAKHIVLYGVDMAGTDYSYGKDLRNRSDAVWSRRWTEERNIIDQVKQYLKDAHDVTIEHRVMDPA